MQVRQLNILRLRSVTFNQAAFSHVAEWEQAWGYGEVFREEGLANSKQRVVEELKWLELFW